MACFFGRRHTQTAQMVEPRASAPSLEQLSEYPAVPSYEEAGAVAGGVAGGVAGAQTSAPAPSPPSLKGLYNPKPVPVAPPVVVHVAPGPPVPCSRPRRMRRSVAGCRKKLRTALDGQTFAPADLPAIVTRAVRIVRDRAIPPIDVADVSGDLVWEVVCRLWTEWQEQTHSEIYHPLILAMCRETAVLLEMIDDVGSSGSAESGGSSGSSDGAEEADKGKGCCVVA